MAKVLSTTFHYTSQPGQKAAPLFKCAKLVRAMNHKLKTIKNAAWFVNKEGHSSTHWYV